MNSIAQDRQAVKYPPQELSKYHQWILWKYGPRKLSNGRHEKMPLNPSTGRAGNPHDPSNWLSYEHAVSIQTERGYDGVGFVLTPEINLTCVDVDVLDELTLEIADRFDSYTELTPSGNGIHVWVEGTKPVESDKDWYYKERKIEVYSAGQFITFTGNKYSDYRPTVEDRQSNLDQMWKYCKPKEEPKQVDTGFLVQHHRIHSLDDNQVLDKARNAKNGEKFRALYDHGDTSRYGGDMNRACLALCQLLNQWCNGDAEQIDRLFRRSALMRPKWDSKRVDSTWGANVIKKAISTHQTYTTPGVPNGDSQTKQGVSNDNSTSVPNDNNTGVPNVEFDFESDSRVLSYMVEQSVPNGGVVEFSGSQKSIADALGISTRTVKKAIRRIMDRYPELLVRAERASHFQPYTYLISAVLDSSEDEEKEDSASFVSSNDSKELNVIESFSKYGLGSNTIKESIDSDAPQPYLQEPGTTNSLETINHKTTEEKTLDNRNRRLTEDEVEAVRALKREGYDMGIGRKIVLGEIAKEDAPRYVVETTPQQQQVDEVKPTKEEICRRAVKYVGKTYGEEMVMRVFSEEYDLIAEAMADLSREEFWLCLWQLVLEAADEPSNELVAV